MTRRRGVTALVTLLVVLVAFVSGACGIPLDSSPRSVSVGSAGHAAAGSPTSGGDTSAYLYFVTNDHMAPIDREVTTKDAESVVKVLLAGPTTAETMNGLITQIPGGTLVRYVRSGGGTTRVALSQQFQNVIGSAGVEAIAQLVFTVTELDPGTKVEFLVGGQVVKVTSPTRGDVQRVGECDFVSLLPTDDQLRGTVLTGDATRHLTALRKSLTAKCPAGPSS